MEQGYRSEVQERALVVSLQMFSLILERGVSLLKTQLESRQEPRLVVGEDLQVLLPAIKVGRLFPPPIPLLSSRRPPLLADQYASEPSKVLIAFRDASRRS